ncbi:MAG: tetratricopeptide repeat protein [Acidithiobacillus ferriphilus]
MLDIFFRGHSASKKSLMWSVFLGIVFTILWSSCADASLSWKGWSPWNPNMITPAEAMVLRNQMTRGAAIQSGVEQAARAGNITDMNTLGVYYCWVHNYPKALYWYRQSAIKGNAEGEYELGYFLSTGPDVPHDLPKAIAWLHKAEAQKDGVAAYFLAYLHRHGIGFPKSTSVALQDDMRAARDGYSQAAFALQKMYKDGLDGVSQDPQKAVYWSHYENQTEKKEVARDFVQNARYLHTQKAFYYYEYHNILPGQKNPDTYKPQPKQKIFAWAYYGVTHGFALLTLLALFFQRKRTKQHPQGASPFFWFMLSAYSAVFALMYGIGIMTAPSISYVYYILYFAFYSVCLWLAFDIFRLARKAVKSEQKRSENLL